LSEGELDPDVGVVSFDKFEGSFASCGIKVISGVRMSCSLIFEVCINFDVRWEIVLLSPEDLYELVTELSVFLGRHCGNSSVFQELIGKPNLC